MNSARHTGTRLVGGTFFYCPGFTGWHFIKERGDLHEIGFSRPNVISSVSYWVVKEDRSAESMTSIFFLKN